MRGPCLVAAVDRVSIFTGGRWAPRLVRFSLLVGAFMAIVFDVTVGGRVFRRHAWTGGSTPPKRFRSAEFVALRRFFFRELVSECGGLDLWECAGTSALDRARIFWNQARFDAWSTLRLAGVVA